MKLYVPSTVPYEYTYLGNFTNTYFDLYNSSNPQGNVSYYRIFYSYDDNAYLEYNTTIPTMQSHNYPSIDRTDSIFQSISNYKYFIIAFIIIFLIVFICNIVTSIFKRGGIFSGT